MVARKVQDFPGGRKFRFDFEPNSKLQVSADDILESMNRSLKVEEILGYDPQLESLMAKHSGIRSRGSSGKLVSALMLISGLIVAWLYGVLAKILQVSFWKSQVGILGYAIPFWLVGSTGMLVLLACITARRSAGHSRNLADSC